MNGSILAIAAPFLTAALIGLLPPLRRRRRLVFVVSALASLAAVSGFSSARPGEVLLSLQWIDWMRQADFLFAVDPLTALMGKMAAAVSFTIIIFARWYMGHETDAAYGRFMFLVSLFVGAMMLMVASRNILAYYLFWEIMGFCSYALIGFWYDRPNASRAALKAFWTTRVGDLGFLLAIAVLLREGVGFEFNQVSWWLVHAEGAAPLLAFGGLITAVAGKSAQFPLFFWLPDAMEGPTPVSALIHAATMVCAGVILLINLQPAMVRFGTVVLLLGAGTALLAAVQALFAWEIKKVLAFSTISQLGYMVAGIGAGSAVAAAHHLTAHAGFKALLFLAAGAVLHGVHTQKLGETGNIFRRMPVVGFAFAVGLAALAGLWPFSGFFSKDAVLLAVMERLPVAAGLLLIGVLCTGMYSGRLLRYLIKAGDAEPVALPLAVRFPLLALALLTAAYGAVWIPNAVAMPHSSHFAWIPWTGLGLAAGGLIFGWAFAFAPWLAEDRRGARVTRSNYGLDQIATAVVRGPVLAFGGMVAWFDRYVVDGVLNVIGLTSWRLARWQMRREPVTVNAIMRWMAAGILLLIMALQAGGVL